MSPPKSRWFRNLLLVILILYLVILKAEKLKGFDFQLLTHIHSLSDIKNNYSSPIFNAIQLNINALYRIYTDIPIMDTPLT